MDTKTRRLILYELSGYFRGAKESTEEGIGNSIEKMLLIGNAFGSGGVELASAVMDNIGICSTRYRQAITDTLEGK